MTVLEIKHILHLKIDSGKYHRRSLIPVTHHYYNFFFLTFFRPIFVLDRVGAVVRW